MSKARKSKSSPPPGDESPESLEPSTDVRGLECPECGCRHFYVIYTRRRQDRIVRRRQCRHCGRLVLSVERLIG